MGHAQDEEVMTGTTVVLLDKPSITACDARGGWAGGYDTTSVEPGRTFFRKQAVFLTGGDVFGYDAAMGIRKYLTENKFAGARQGNMPEIVGANIYDLSFAKNAESVNYGDLGYRACVAASSGPVKQGNVGAGIGATVGKLRGAKFCWKGGLGSSAVLVFGNAMVGAMVVTNAVGNVFDPATGKVIAGTRRSGRGPPFLEMDDVIPEYVQKPRRDKKKVRATTIGVIITNLSLTHEQTFKVAQMAHDGLARAIRPVHMTIDGDIVFAVSTGEVDFSHASADYMLVDVVGATSAQQMSAAILNAVRNATSLGGAPGLLK